MKYGNKTMNMYCIGVICNLLFFSRNRQECFRIIKVIVLVTIHLSSDILLSRLKTGSVTCTAQYCVCICTVQIPLAAVDQINKLVSLCLFVRCCNHIKNFRLKTNICTRVGPDALYTILQPEIAIEKQSFEITEAGFFYRLFTRTFMHFKMFH